MLFPCYARQQMAGYSQTMRDLAFNFGKFAETDDIGPDDRREYFYRKQMSDGWQQLGQRFREVSNIVDRISKESYTYAPFQGMVEGALRRRLKHNNMELKECYVIKNDNGIRRYSLFLRNAGRKMHSTEEVAEVLGQVLRLAIMPGRTCPVFLGFDTEEFLFEERERFYLMTGQARAIKEGEKYSGDNLSVTQTPFGKTVLMLSDGVGSGQNACSDSARMIDLAENYYESGFERNETLGVLEGMMFGTTMENRMPTLDLCEVDLHSGECEMLKLGSAPGLIVREDGVEWIESTNLLLGYVNQEEMITQKRHLTGGEYLILMTDGVAEYVTEQVKIKLYTDLYHKRGNRNPNVLAQRLLRHVLQESGGQIRDDMTILAAGVFVNPNRHN